MITIQGKGVSGGIAKGRLYFLRRPDAVVPRERRGGLEEELARLTAAQERVTARLQELADRCRDGEQVRALLETHAMLAEDEDFAACIQNLLAREGCSAEYAAERAGEEFAALFSAAEDPYLRARAADIRDVARRICGELMGVEEHAPGPEEPVVLAADDLAPSETARLDREKILAFVIREGSALSHTAILARAMGIPAICGVGEALGEEYAGQLCCVDAGAGRLIIDPSGAQLAELEELAERQRRLARSLESMKGERDVTLDGRQMLVCCNIASPEETAAVLQNGGQGIGLFRSEFLYLGAEACPTEEEQFRAYRAVVAAMEGKRVVIRTLDLGGDKRADCLHLRREENPALGERAIRLCLNRPELFRTQLRAVYRASAFGRVAILIPMITSVWEIRACREICAEVMAELDAEGIAYDKNLELGIMIETPAAALIADVLAEEADFFSVGTNDLSQYTLACDRRSGELERFFDPRHPAVLRAVKMAADAAHAAGIRIGICGELGSDPELLPTFLAMGIDELSVSPGAVLPLRAAIRHSIAGECTLEKLQYREGRSHD